MVVGFLVWENLRWSVFRHDCRGYGPRFELRGGGVFLVSEILGMKVFSASKDSGGGWILGLGEFEVECFPTRLSGLRTAI